MSFRTARGPWLRPRRTGSLFFLVCASALSFRACGEPEARVVARFPADASVAAGGTSTGGGDAADAPDAPNVPDAGAAGIAGKPPIPIPRGRVRVMNGLLTTDLGTPLRGVVFPVDKDFVLRDHDYGLVDTIAQTTGLNTIHVYLENFSLATGVNSDAGDALVALTAQAGMYLVLGYGSGVKVGSFNQAKLTAFWKFYGTRYASQPHVLFEIQNNPENDTCNRLMDAATLSMELATYKLIRSVAPDTHVLFFSTTTIVQPNVFTDAVTRLGAAVPWSNESFSMDVTADCLPYDLPKLVAAAKVKGVPLLISQLPTDIKAWGPDITQFEQAQIGWFHFRWFAQPPDDLASLVSSTTSAGVTWCPERGSFPRDSSLCDP